MAANIVFLYRCLAQMRRAKWDIKAVKFAASEFVLKGCIS